MVQCHELLWIIEHRLGRYVGRPTHDRAFATIIGFDLARRRGELRAFQN
jgi:hypothetical protein